MASAPALAFDGPACGPGWHYACWHDPYGTRRCGCWPAETPACPYGYHYTCRATPSGYPYCACY